MVAVLFWTLAICTPLAVFTWAGLALAPALLATVCLLAVLGLLGMLFAPGSP